MKKKTYGILLLSALALLSCGSPSSSSSESSTEQVSSSSSSPLSSSVISPVSYSFLTSESEPTLESSDTQESPQESSESSSESSESSEETRVAYTYEGYYDALVSWTNGEDLKQQLHDIISSGDYAPLSYAGSIPNWYSNQKADQDLYDHEFVDAVYTDAKIAKGGTSTYWQREHAFCASLMCGETTGEAVKTYGRATDFHNLFASAAGANSSRGNKNYGYADKNAEGYVDRTTENGRDGYSFDPKTFEPGDKDKGRLSRAIFYMATMYGQDEYDGDVLKYKGLKIVEDDVPYVAGKNCAFAIGHRSDLLEWSAFPVDLSEYQHNESVYSFVPEVHSDPSRNCAQGNRNPYVDYPGLVDYVFGNKKDEPGKLSDLVSSYEALSIGEDATRYYAVKEAKREYDEDESFSLDDVSIVSVANDFQEIPFEEFEVIGAEEGKAFDHSGKQEITIKTPLNMLTYEINVWTDPVLSATYHHLLTGKTAGSDFDGKAENSGVHNILSLSEVKWDVYWEAGVIGNYSNALGCKFGTASVPAKKIVFESVEEFSYQGKEDIAAVYIRGAAASGKSYPVTFYVNDEKLYQGNLGYVDTKTPVSVGKRFATLCSGKLRIEITNITAGVNIQYLSVDLD